MSTIGGPILVPNGALVRFSDGRIATVADGSVAAPTDMTDVAGFLVITAEQVQLNGAAANAAVMIALDHPPLVPGTLTISSLDPLVLTDNGTGHLIGDVGSGIKRVDLASGLGQCSFVSDAAGPIIADYKQFGVSVGTVFILTGPSGEPLGMGTITLVNGAPLQGGITPSGDVYETVEFVVDPDPSAPTLTLTNPNLDKRTLEKIGRQLARCSGLVAHEAILAGKNVPWLRRGTVLEVPGLHDEFGADFSLPALLIAERKHEQGDGRSGGVARDVKGLAWTQAEIRRPVGAKVPPSGNAATFSLRGVWQANTSYAALDVVRAATGIADVLFVAARQWDRGTFWALPALSGAVNPFGALVDGLIRPIDMEGRTVVDRDINAWLGFRQIVTLTGTMSGQALLLRDGGGVTHYVTYYPSVDVWTDTPTAPGM